MTSQGGTSRPSAGAVDVIVIGAGHSGLAISHCLRERSIEHVVLERGNVANSWRHERWDSLRLLTPNWLSRLPGFSYAGPDPDGFMSVDEVIAFVSRYADKIRAPLCVDTTVIAVEPAPGGYRVRTTRGDWCCRALVVATGACNKSSVPALSQDLPKKILQLTSHQYRNPGQLAPGPVLVVGASATGLQLSQEISRAGHLVTLAVGEHVRMPRIYRGRDIQWWMHAAGILDQRYDEVDDIVRARRLPSPQLHGDKDQPFMDLNLLAAQGIQIVGRLAGIRDGKAQFSGSLRNVCALADLKMNRLLTTIDDWADTHGHNDREKERFPPTGVPQPSCLELDLKSAGVRTVLWATGYRPDFSWLTLPVLDRKGWIRHDGGVGNWPGLYVTGMPFLRRRKSTFMHGAEDDARDLVQHLAAWLGVNGKSLSAGVAV